MLANAPTQAQALVVEVEVAARKALMKLVTRFGYEVKGAGSAKEGDSWLSAMRFDLFLLDVELPKMKGM